MDPGFFIERILKLIEKLSKNQKKDSVTDFNKVREHLKKQRKRLAFDAINYYSKNHSDIDFLEIEDVPLLTIKEWVPDRPIDISTIKLKFVTQFQDDKNKKLHKYLSKLLPFDKNSSRYSTYSNAIEALDKPTYFSDNKSYRLIEINTKSRNKPKMTFTNARYFDHINFGELLAFEFAKNDLFKKVSLKDNKNISRKTLGDPFVLTNRPVLPGIITLTIRQESNGDTRFYMHKRESKKVAIGMDSYSVIPAGEFQPSTNVVYGEDEDFCLWKNIMREYSEELLGAKEHYNEDGRAVNYDRPPFSQFEKAISEGKARCYYMGFGFDPLNLKGEILTVCIWDADTFDDVFANICEYNEEGRVISHDNKGNDTKGIPFNKNIIDRYVHEDNITPAGIACLKLALKHKEKLGLIENK